MTRKIKTLLLSLAGSLLCMGSANALPTCSEVTPLVAWYSPSRGDNMTTADEQWRGPIGVQRTPDYRAYAIEGFVFLTAQPGTTPLYRWWSPSRGDNFTTSDPAWAGREGESRSGYQFVRIEGHLFAPGGTQPDATVPLDSSYSRGREDNYSSSDPVWTGSIGKENSPGYSLYRREGFVFERNQFAGCSYPVLDEAGALPDLIVTDIHRSAGRFLFVSVMNAGADGIVTDTECSASGSAASNRERIMLSRGASRLIRVSVWPGDGAIAHCAVRGKDRDTETPEPYTANNEMEKVPTF